MGGVKINLPEGLCLHHAVISALVFMQRVVVRSAPDNYSQTGIQT